MSKGALVAGGMIGAAILLGAFAQPGPHRPPRTRAELEKQLARYFEVADVDDNNSKAVSWDDMVVNHDNLVEEYTDGRDNPRERIVKLFDRNLDGRLSEAELKGEAGPLYKGPAHPYGEDQVRNQAWHMIVSGTGGGIGTSKAWFQQADANHDGSLSPAEAGAGPRALFEQIDTNHDGTISPEELAAIRATAKDLSVKTGSV